MGARILVADDSVTIQKVVELTFSKEDFLLIQARSGEEAIRKAREERPDLVLLDLVMPDKNGYEVCEALRAEPMLQTVPIVLLAGTFEALDKERASAAGATDFVSKPFESHVLVGKVKQLLFARAMSGGGGPGPAPAARPPAPSTVTAAPPPAVLEPPAEAPRTPDSQDHLWQLLDADATPAPQPPGAGAPEAAIDVSAFEEAGLDLDLLPEPTAPPKAGAGALEIVPVPGSLSLDDLLGPETGADAAPAAAEAPPVFELADEGLPGLPLVEPAQAAWSGPEEAGAAGAELDFASLAEELKPGPLAVEGEPPAFELELDPPATSEGTATLEAPVASEPAPAVETADGALPAFLGEPALPPEAPAAGADLETVRRAVAGRVAEQLAKELSQKLMERIERVVWEVVPDLAEILIAKEIERIRQLADEQKSS